MIELDGSFGEGGGQILRTSLALSIVTGKPFRIHKIRAKRKSPGLQPQHLMAVRAAARVGLAETIGDALHSQTLEFSPQGLQTGTHHFAIGTAGSASLVFQTVLPPLMRAEAPSRIVIDGGTHNEHAPPFEFLDKAFLPLIRRLGPDVALTLERYGFYPRGGGRLVAEIIPRGALKPFDLADTFKMCKRFARALVVHLPASIAERELAALQRRLDWNREEMEIAASANAFGAGNVLTAELQQDELTEVFSAIGRLGRRAEEVAKAVADEVAAYLDIGAPVGLYLCDQLLMPLAIAGGGSFVTGSLSQHAETNLSVISRFLPVTFAKDAIDAHRWKITIKSAP
jgi:RNA 3'-terminal phosphate cyclase (ATP)